jgi:uncharacterized protein DUF6777/zinc ribbon protein
MSAPGASCPNCGAANVAGTTFCIQCGTRLTGGRPAGQSPPAPAASAGPPPPAPPKRGFNPRVLTAIVTVLALVAGLVVFVLSREEAQAAVIYEQPLAPGPDPFTNPVDVSAASVGAVIPTPGSTASPTPQTSPGGTSSPGGTGSPPTSVTPSPGPTSTQPFGGTGSNTVCDRELLIRSLQANPTAGAEWARVRGMSMESLPVYIRGLTPATLTADTRVTNHSLTGGRARPFQSILPAGTAVLLDSGGRVVARCRCGNPLLNAIPVSKGTCKGCPSGYRPPAILPPTAPAPAVAVINPPAVVGATPSPTPSPTPIAEPPSTNVSIGAVAEASSTYNAEFPARFGIDERKDTSWFSKGPDPQRPRDPTTFTVTFAAPTTITRLEFVDNRGHPDRNVHDGFGFRRWHIELFNASGTSVHTIRTVSNPLRTQTVAVPSIAGVVRAVFYGFEHEAPDCGGFGALWFFGYRA